MATKIAIDGPGGTDFGGTIGGVTVHRYYLFLTPPQVWGVLINSDVDVAYILLRFLLGKCALLRRWQKLVHFSV